MKIMTIKNLFFGGEGGEGEQRGFLLSQQFDRLDNTALLNLIKVKDSCVKSVPITTTLYDLSYAIMGPCCVSLLVGRSACRSITF